MVGLTSQAGRERALTLAALTPALGFVLIFFVVPLCFVFAYSINGPGLGSYFPNYTIARGSGPQAEVAALGKDVAQLKRSDQFELALRRVRSADRNLADALRGAQPRGDDAPFDGSRLAASNSQFWSQFGDLMGRYTIRNYLAAVDMERRPDGSWGMVAANRRVYTSVLLNTFSISLVTAILSLLFGYPLAYWINSRSPRTQAVVLGLLLIPLWTSFLVRTYGWIIMLQTNGALNWAVETLHLSDTPLYLMNTRVGLYIAMVHVLLPLLVFPLLSVMRTIPDDYVKAAMLHGATPFRAFWKAYLPLTYPGVMAGTVLVFVIALGYYITPALIGGPGETTISMLIAMNVNTLLNWGMAGALSMIVLFITLVLFAIYGKSFSKAGLV